MSEQGRQPTPEELQAAYEAELKRLRVEDVLIQTVVSLINLGGRKAGLAAGTEDEADPDQLHRAIEAARALLPLVEPELGPDAARVREALSQLQLAYARLAGGGAGAGAPEPPAPGAGEPGPPPPGPGAPPPPPGGQRTPGGDTGPAQRSGRLWIPGQ